MFEVWGCGLRVDELQWIYSKSLGVKQTEEQDFRNLQQGVGLRLVMDSPTTPLYTFRFQGLGFRVKGVDYPLSDN